MPVTTGIVSITTVLGSGIPTLLYFTLPTISLGVASQIMTNRHLHLMGPRGFVLQKLANWRNETSELTQRLSIVKRGSFEALLTYGLTHRIYAWYIYLYINWNFMANQQVNIPFPWILWAMEITHCHAMWSHHLAEQLILFLRTPAYHFPNLKFDQNIMRVLSDSQAACVVFSSSCPWIEALGTYELALQVKQK